MDKVILKKKIQDLIITFKDDIEKMKEMTKPIGPENSIGRISRMDAINNKSVMEASLRSKQKKMKMLSMALQQIDDPNFGACAHCGNYIQEKRLMYMPESLYCIKCADKYR